MSFDDAAPALDSVDFARVDLVITDLDMPTPGTEAIRQLRTCGIQTPIIVLSGSVDPENSETLYALGAQAVVSKPANLGELDLIVELLLLENEVWAA